MELRELLGLGVANHYWPALYFVDRGGVIRDHHFGEGRYRSRSGSSRSCWVYSARRWWWRGRAWRPRRTGTTSLTETYLGGLRGERRVNAPPGRLGLNEWTLTGAWAARAEHVALEAAGGGIACRFHAPDAHLVMSGAGLTPSRSGCSWTRSPGGPTAWTSMGMGTA